MSGGDAFGIDRTRRLTGEEPRLDLIESRVILGERLVPDRGTGEERLQPVLHPIRQVPDGGMQPPIGSDGRAARAIAQKVADRQRRPVVPFEIAGAGLGADRAAALVEEGRPIRAVEPRIHRDIDP